LVSPHLLTNYFVKWQSDAVRDLDVIDDPAVAVAALDPVRAKILATLAEPGSATTVALALGLSRQKVNYHMRTLEAHDLVRLVEARPKRGLTERVMVASARAYVLSPVTLGENAADPTRTDRLSTRYLIAVAARMVREVAQLARLADNAGKPLATLAIDTEIRFASATERAAFTAELTTAVTALTSKYHDETASRGRWHRVIVAAHPSPHHSTPSSPRRPEHG
jgi:DNA-binding transcriptional ArsR family regulator